MQYKLTLYYWNLLGPSNTASFTTILLPLQLLLLTLQLLLLILQLYMSVVHLQILHLAWR